MSINNKLTLPLEAGKYYRTRDGRKVYITSIELPNPFSASPELWTVSVRMQEDEGRRYYLTGEGRSETYGQHSLDIVADWIEPRVAREFWINEYPLSIGTVWWSRPYESSEDAAGQASRQLIRTIHLREVLDETD